MPHTYMPGRTREMLKNFLIGEEPQWPWPVVDSLTCEQLQAMHDRAVVMQLPNSVSAWQDADNDSDACENR